MFWADKVAQELKERKLPLEWVDDMKTPSGRIHVGALRGVVVHDLVYKALEQNGVNGKYTYVFEDHDPMDDVPVYLPESFREYLGRPLFTIPSPVEGFDNYAQYYAEEFKSVFNAIGCYPEILWTKDFYLSGQMNEFIKTVLDNADVIREIYSEMYKKELPNDWYPFQVVSPTTGKISGSAVIDWDGEMITYDFSKAKEPWNKGNTDKGKMSAYSSKDKFVGKLPWKIEWPAKWKIIGVTVEGGGKDHMSAGGSHDLARQVSERVFNYPVPYPLPYEFFLVGGKKMSSSKGRGSGAAEMLEYLPPELLRFLMVRTKINQAINLDPSGDTIPNLFDEYQRAADAYFNKTDEELARIFELSQITRPPASLLAGEVGRDGIKKPPVVRFSILAQWIQMPNMEQEIKEEGLQEWAQYAKVWVEKYAPESEKFLVQKELPNEARNLSDTQKKFLQKVSIELDKKWEAEAFQKELYEWAKEIGISSKDAFAAIYIALIGKNHGPKAAWLILSLDKEFIKKRFNIVRHSGKTEAHPASNKVLDSGQARLADALAKRARMTINSSRPRQTRSRTITSSVFSIDSTVKEKFPTVNIGVAVIKGVTIEKINPELEKEKEALLKFFESLTTEQLGQYSEVLSYRKLYKEMGIDWHSRRPSPEALLRRVALKKGLYAINTCVDAYNLVVMKYRVSIGAFDFDALKFPTILRFPKQGEEILLLSDTEPTKYSEKELAYFDKVGGFNIDFNFRDAQRTAVQMHTKNLYINVDGIYDITPKMVERSLKEACDMIMKYCGGTLEEFGVVVS